MPKPTALRVLALFLAHAFVGGMAQTSFAQSEPAAPAEAQSSVAAAQAPSGPAPVAVLSIPSEQLAPPIAAAVQAAVVAELTPMVRRRDVRAVTDETMVAAAQACETPDCIGAIVANFGAVLGVIVRTSRQNLRSPVAVIIDLVDPVSGVSRLESPLEGSMEADQVETPTPIVQAMIANLASHMPAAPPQTSLLITSNVDGAQVSINGQSVGETPLPPGQTRAGRYQVQVTRDGFRAESRDVEVTEGQATRIDFSLEPDEETTRLDSAGLDYRDQAPPPVADGSVTSEWWFWAAVGGGAVLAIGAVILIVAASSGGDPLPPRESILLPPLR